MSRALLLGGLGFGRLALVRRRRNSGFRSAESSGFRYILVHRLLHRIPHGDPATLGARHGPLDQDEPALNIGLHHLEIERGYTIHTHMPGHLLVLESLAGVLTAASRTDRPVRDRNAVGGAEAAEVPALHATRKALADRRARDIDILTRHEVIGGDFRTNRDQFVFLDAKL